MYVYLYSLHVSGSHVPIIGRINCINTTSGIRVCHSVEMTVYFAGLDENAKRYQKNLLPLSAGHMIHVFLGLMHAAVSM